MQGRIFFKTLGKQNALTHQKPPLHPDIFLKSQAVTFMNNEARIFSIADYIRPSKDEPIRSVVLQTAEAVIVVWHVQPGQEITAHIHPHGQDTWTVLSGTAEYFQGNGVVCNIKTNDIAVAKPNQVHGARNTGLGAFVFVSVVASGSAGFALAEK